MDSFSLRTNLISKYVLITSDTLDILALMVCINRLADHQADFSFKGDLNLHEISSMQNYTVLYADADSAKHVDTDAGM